MRALALENLVLLDGDEAVAIAGRAAFGAGLAVAGQAYPHAVIDAGGNRHVELGPFLHVAATATIVARVGDSRAGSLARGASGLDAEYAGGLNDLAATLAVRAGGPLRAWLTARAFASGASFIAWQLDILDYAFGGLFERQRDIDANIGTATHAATAAAAPLSAEHLAENVAKRFEDVFNVVELVRELVDVAVRVARLGRRERIVHGGCLSQDGQISKNGQAAHARGSGRAG